MRSLTYWCVRGPKSAPKAMTVERPSSFETDRALYALTATLFSVQAFDGFSYRDVTKNNSELTPYKPFGNGAKETAALYLGFKYPTKYAGPKEFPKIDLVSICDGQRCGRAKPERARLRLWASA